MIYILCTKKTLLYIMNTTTLTIKIDKKTKEESQKVAEELGFSLSAIIKSQLRNLIRTKRVDVSLREEKPTAYFDKALKDAEEDIKAGRVISFKDTDEVLEYLDKKMEYEKKNHSKTSH